MRPVDRKPDVIAARRRPELPSRVAVVAATRARPLGPTLWPMADPTPAEFLIAFAIAAGVGTLVFFHADRNGIRHPSAWAGFVFLFLLVGLPSYLVYVRRVRRR